MTHGAPVSIPFTDSVPAPSDARLEVNLALLGPRSARAAARIRGASPMPELEFVTTLDEGAPSAILNQRALASRRRPLQEAQDIAQAISPDSAGGVVVLGFGLGHHVAAIAHRIRRAGVVVVFEPDASLLREVLRRVDITKWAQASHVVLLTSDDAAEASESLRQLEPLLASGVEVIDHAPSRARLGAAGPAFSAMFARLCASVRTHMVTTMMQTDTTVRNLLMNSDHYACDRGIADLSRLAAGFPAIVVSAGPSLRRTIDLLATPGLRERCVIIAVQTVLKTLLSHGIRPHFVTALDYHEVSKRFYEGLSENDVRGITLVAEPKANPAILQAFPGSIRLVADRVLEQVAGDIPACAHAPLESGATVAHLAYYLARHLGCDPVAFIGQDLAFTDGQYYSRGAAIHTVWSGELNAFNTLEMMEWERIARNRAHLHRVSDDLGRPIYTDDQMRTYLSQFERDFLADAEKGLTTIDATGGGVKKLHTTAMPLREVIERFIRPGDSPTLPELPVPERTRDEVRIARLRDRIERIRHDVRTISARSEETVRLLERMPALQGNASALNPLIDRAHAIRDELQRLDPAYPLVLRLNQLGAFKRLRADRAIYLEESLTPAERQLRQIERDTANVRWIGEIAGVFEGMLRDTSAMLRGGPRQTRDATPREPEPQTTATQSSGASVSPASRAIGVLVVCDPRTPSARFMGEPALARTIRALSGIEPARHAVLLNPCADDLRQASSAIESLRAANWTVEIVHHEPAPTDVPRDRAGNPRGPNMARAIGVARRFAPSGWRGGIGAVTVFDELLANPEAALHAIERLGVDAALCVGADWALLDPALCQSVIERYLESPASNRLCFTQAPPGLCGCVIERGLLGELVASRRVGNPFSLIGGLLCYNPYRAAPDPIVKPCCATIDPGVRDAGERFIPDSPARIARLEQFIRESRGDSSVMSAAPLAHAAAMHGASRAGPLHVTLELNTDRLTGGESLLLRGIGSSRRAPIDPSLAARIIDMVAREPDATLTLAGDGDPLLHPCIGEILQHARAALPGGVHVRTDGILQDSSLEALRRFPPDVLSVDVLANRAETYAALTGRDEFRRVLEFIDEMLKWRASSGADEAATGGCGPSWVVPRIARCDAVQEEIETFYDKWLLVAHAAMIDQPVRVPAGSRIEPLGKPAHTRRRDALERMTILCDGRVICDERDRAGEHALGDLRIEEIGDCWSRVIEARAAALRASPESPDACASSRSCSAQCAHDAAWTGW